MTEIALIGNPNSGIYQGFTQCHPIVLKKR